MATLTGLEAAQLVDKLYDKLTHQAREARQLDQAYRGEHKLRFLTPKWAEYHGERYKDFSDNWCGVVANSPAERLRVIGFRVDPAEATGTPSSDEQWLWRNVWGVNRLDAQSSQGILQAIIAKRSYAIVWGDSDDNPVVTWESPEQVYVDYDPETGQARYALKAWSDDDDSKEYATLYTPTEVFKFERVKSSAGREGQRVTSGGLIIVGYVGSSFGNARGGWEPRQPASDDTWPLENPLGRLNVVEFQNRPMLGRKPLSEIQGTRAMQDAINLLWAYLFNAADFASFPARVVMGQEPPKLPILDTDGQKIGERQVDLRKLSEDRILWLTGENAKIGEWTAAKLDVFTNVIEVAVAHIGAQTRTPQHYFVGKMSNISPDGFKAAETGLVKKCEEAQLFLDDSLAELFSLGAAVNGRDNLAQACLTGKAQWKDAESRSDAQLVDQLTKLDAIGFPFEYLAERYGLSPLEVQRIVGMKRRELHDVLLADASMSNPAGDGQAGQTGLPGQVQGIETRPLVERT